ncbi:MAG: carbamoyltransferase N-terminal domain-containing protein, partial [Nannocystaceae bacterium]
PLRAVDACLEIAGIDPGALDQVVFYEQPFAKLERVMLQLVRTFPRSWRQFPRALASQLGVKIWALDHLAEGIGVDRSKVRCIAHHRSHAASAFYTSGFEHAAVLVVDGVGEHSSTSLWHGRGTDLRAVSSIDFPHSLGLLYAAVTAYLGFAVNEGEYKVMGLAAWGQPTRKDAFAKILICHADGSYELALEYFAHMTDTELGFGPALEQLLGPRRPPGRPWDFSDAQDRAYADIAASLQQALEEVLLGLARQARRWTEAPGLCLAGGVALNAVANARLARESGFESVYVQPAAGDAGGALGAAVIGSLDLGDPRPPALHTAALGPAIAPTRAYDLAHELGLACTRVEDPAQAIAQAIVDQKIVAYASGRVEWGPRALGQRSILADPTARRTRERINRAIKHREVFRPFAPA